MSPKIHKLYIGFFVLITLIITIVIAVKGYSYYIYNVADRFHHPDYHTLKPSGFLGHGYGIVGTLLILFGISVYMIRKRVKRFSRIGVLKYWLEFHIFLCTLGPILILYHTSFKFGGIVSVSFWSMVAVVISGVIGRYIYLQIPRTIEGREMSLKEVNSVQSELKQRLVSDFGIEADLFNDVPGQKRLSASDLKKELKRLDKKDIKKAVHFFKSANRLSYRIRRLERMQNLFRYWHVAHLPFALIMLIIMVIHVVITLLFGHRWVF